MINLKHSLLCLSIVVIAACGDVAKTSSATTSTDTSSTSAVNGDGTVNLGPQGGTPTTPVVTDEPLESLLIDIDDIDKHIVIHTSWFGLVKKEEKVTKTFDFSLTISTLGIHGLSPISAISDVVEISAYRKDASGTKLPVTLNHDRMALIGGQGTMSVTAQFPNGNEWKEEEPLYIEAVRPDPDATDDDNGYRMVTFEAWLKRAN